MAYKKSKGREVGLLWGVHYIDFLWASIVSEISKKKTQMSILPITLVNVSK